VSCRLSPPQTIGGGGPEQSVGSYRVLGPLPPAIRPCPILHSPLLVLTFALLNSH
jgi:hypothetical protein